MKRSLIMLSTAWALSAQAHVKVPNLWNEADAQKNWQSVSVEIPGLEGRLSAVLTDGRKVRFENFGVPFTTTAKLESNQWGYFSRRDSFKQDCNLVGNIIDRVRARRTQYSLTFPVIANKPAFINVVHANGRKEQLRGPENRFEPIQWFRVKAEVLGAAVVLRSRLDIADFESKLVGQLERQKQAIAESGVVSLDLTSYDDVACDLLNGNIQLHVSVNHIYSQARLGRSPLFQAAEIDRLYSDLSKRASELESDVDAKIMMPAYLGIGLTKINRDIDQLATWEIQRLYRFLVDATSGRIQPLSNSRMAEIASQMDRLSQGNAMSTPVYTVKIEE